jgi:poly-gamma-glutamate synthase PgsB/CapB
MPADLFGPLAGGQLADAELFATGIAAFVVCVLWLGVTASRHRRNLRAVPVRIHVAGTRGKSTTTRMIAAGLRAGGRRVVAKATGAEPRLIRPDGVEEAWPRRGPPSVREQVRLFGRAVGLGADTIVVECMAIRPEFVWASEAHLVRSTTAVITNARADHFEDVGDDPDAMADALRWVVPDGGRLIVSDEAASPALLSRAAAKGAALTIVNTSALQPVAADRALALAVCTAHGVPQDVALPAIDAAVPDPGNFFERTVAVGDKTIRFANAFSCNDVDSLALLWRERTGAEAAAVLLNARPDRPLRTKKFIEFVAAQEPTPRLFIAGDPFAILLARRVKGIAGSVRRLRARTPDAALAEVASFIPAGGVVWGVGNYQGLGARMVAELAGRDAAC